eukprot:m.230177 g.230177  ORF g.230177 m.230177 type:complete len:59 (-) comp15997_c1_seq17:228-404(-)
MCSRLEQLGIQTMKFTCLYQKHFRIVSACTSTPADVVKTRIMDQSGGESEPCILSKYA